MLSRRFPDQAENLIMFISSTFDTTECKWALVDKEVYNIIWGINKLHQFLYGRSFTLNTNNKI